jgi:hypothetical protein
MERLKLKRNRYTKAQRYRVFIIKILIIAVIGIFIFQFMTVKVEETLITLCKAKVESIGVAVSNKAIDDVMEKVTYEDLVNFVKDDTGRIIALKSDVLEMNSIASKVAGKIQKMYDELEDIYIYVPLRKFYRK